MIPDLTEREKQIVILIGEGNLTKQIAGKLFISSRTVESHRANIHKKIGAGSTSELIQYALAFGMIRNRYVEVSAEQVAALPEQIKTLREVLTRLEKIVQG